MEKTNKNRVYIRNCKHYPAIFSFWFADANLLCSEHASERVCCFPQSFVGLILFARQIAVVADRIELRCHWIVILRVMWWFMEKNAFVRNTKKKSRRKLDGKQHKNWLKSHQECSTELKLGKISLSRVEIKTQTPRQNQTAFYSRLFTKISHTQEKNAIKI